MSWFSRRPATLPTPEEALPGRAQPMPIPDRHEVLDAPLQAPWPEGTRTAQFALGCFWGAEKTFWNLPGVVSTAVGYAGGSTPNPTYEEVCTGRTGHAETVLVAHDPSRVSYEALLRTFFENHDPTQGMRQGNDLGTQYRSVIFVADEEQRAAAEGVLRAYDERLREAGFGPITTEIVDAGPFYYAEPYHQQYLIKVPNGYCPDHSTGIACPVGLGVSTTTTGPAPSS